MLQQNKTVTYRRSTDRQGRIPCLLIEGLFLKALGFNLGEQVSVEYKKHQIIISHSSKLNELLGIKE